MLTEINRKQHTCFWWLTRKFYRTQNSRCGESGFDVIDPLSHFSFLALLQSKFEFGCEFSGCFVTHDHRVIGTHDYSTQVAEVEQSEFFFRSLCFVEPFGNTKFWQNILGHRNQAVSFDLWFSFGLQLGVLSLYCLTNGTQTTSKSSFGDASLFNRECGKHSSTVSATRLQTLCNRTNRKNDSRSRRRITWSTRFAWSAITAWLVGTWWSISTRRAISARTAFIALRFIRLRFLCQLFSYCSKRLVVNQLKKSCFL